jgi:hypothetical protein
VVEPVWGRYVHQNGRLDEIFKRFQGLKGT